MPVLPLPYSGARLDGGDLPVSDGTSVLAEYSNAHKAPVTATVRDALNAAFAEIHKAYQDAVGEDFAQVDPLRATGDFLTELALEHSISPGVGESASSVRERIFNARDIVTPQAIVDAVNAIMAPYTSIQCQLVEPEMDGVFIDDGTAVGNCFIYTEAIKADPHYPDRYYADDSAENDGFALTNNLPGGAILSAGYPRNFHLRLPELAASDADFSFVIDGSDEIMAIFDGSQDALADVSSNNFAFDTSKTSDEVYALIVGTVESLKGQGISWSAYVDPYLT